MKSNEVVNFRLKNNLTQKELAKLLGITFQAVMFWENGSRQVPPTTSKLLKLFDKYPQLLKEF